MDYRTFVEKMKEQVQGKLGKSYKVQIITTTKLNGTEKTGLSIAERRNRRKWFLYFIWKNVLSGICRMGDLRSVWKKSVKYIKTRRRMRTRLWKMLKI